MFYTVENRINVHRTNPVDSTVCFIRNKPAVEELMAATVEKEGYGYGVLCYSGRKHTQEIQSCTQVVGTEVSSFGYPFDNTESKTN
jgi:hypothetical protein